MFPDQAADQAADQSTVSMYRYPVIFCARIWSFYSSCVAAFVGTAVSIAVGGTQVWWFVFDAAFSGETVRPRGSAWKSRKSLA